MSGGGRPFRYPGGALLELEVLDAPDAAKAMLREGSAGIPLGL